MSKKVFLSGVQPSGKPHIGNYFGAMRQFVELTKQGKYKPFIFVADYHALNTMQDAEEMQRRGFVVADQGALEKPLPVGEGRSVMVSGGRSRLETPEGSWKVPVEI